MPFDCVEMVTCIHIPQPDCRVPTSTDDFSTVGRERNATDLGDMSFEGANMSTCLDFPQAEGPIEIPTRQYFSIRRKSDAIDMSPMPREKIECLAGLCVIEPNTDPTADRKHFSIG